MAEGDGALPLCASAELAERGPARVFDLLWRGEPVRGFALRFDGAVVAYLNRCAHVPSELDWVPGEFLDHERRYIVCATHGALYEPADGRCRAGPCGRGRLAAITVREADGRVYWYPSADIRPAPSADPGPGSPA
jgi:nitrite reductase/ring-hydroxylating ferredoxin subunit